MVAAVRQGESMRSVARRFAVSLDTVQRWISRAGNQRIDRVDFANQPPGARLPANRVSETTEDLILEIRNDLKSHSALGEYGSRVIHKELIARDITDPPAVRTIGRILERRGALDGRRRRRFPPPPRGWYLPDVASASAELDSFDIIEDLKIEEGPLVDVLTGISLHGGLPMAQPFEAQLTAKTVLTALVDHWRTVGLPAYAQFDNDNRFQGAHHHLDSLSRVMRLCLSLNVIPVFAPPREMGLQAMVESFNGRWSRVVWHRFHHPALLNLKKASERYITACRAKAPSRVGDTPTRHPFPADWALDLQKQPKGRIIYLRRANEKGAVDFLGHTFSVDPHWPHRLVRCEVDLNQNRIDFYARRRREPSVQPLLKSVTHKVPRRKFDG